MTRAWTAEENKEFSSMYGNVPLKKMCKHFLVTENTIRQNAVSLNIVEEHGEFLKFMRRELEKKKPQIATESYYTYKAAIGKLYQFDPRIGFKDLTEDFIIRYREWMVKRGNNENTIGKSLRTLRTYTNLAVRYGLIKKNPFQWYRIKKVNGNREFISKEEFNSLYDMYVNGVWSGMEKEIMRNFLISCTTGLRYGDLRRFDTSCIQDGMIKLKMHKTGNTVTIPLSEKAKYLLNEDKFFMYCNKVTNRYLKAALRKSEIKKRVTFHVARHTFATISITLGMPIEVVSKLLGHTDIKTTQIYAKVVDDVKIKEMQRWNF
jgi:integrase/recombinase XerC